MYSVILFSCSNGTIILKSSNIYLKSNPDKFQGENFRQETHLPNEGGVGGGEGVGKQIECETTVQLRGIEIDYLLKTMYK